MSCKFLGLEFGAWRSSTSAKNHDTQPNSYDGGALTTSLLGSLNPSSTPAKSYTIDGLEADTAPQSKGMAHWRPNRRNIKYQPCQLTYTCSKYRVYSLILQYFQTLRHSSEATIFLMRLFKLPTYTLNSKPKPENKDSGFLVSLPHGLQDKHWKPFIIPRSLLGPGLLYLHV